MKARVLGKGEQIYGERKILVDQLPLETPFVVQISPASLCNFRCNYCIFSNDVAREKYIVKGEMLSFETHKRVIENLSTFPSKIKKLIYVGWGEPLLNKDLPEMVRFAYESDIANDLDIISNGSLLTPEVSDRLSVSGLSALRISMQGINASDYMKTAGIKLDFDSFIDNLRYFSEQKHGSTKLYLKIVDSALSISEEEFYQRYGDIADIISIETTLPLIPDIDYSKIVGSTVFDKTLRGDSFIYHDICPQPFYHLQILPNGEVAPCCNYQSPIICGNMAESSAVEIWNSKLLRHLRVNMLKLKKNKICSECQQYQHSMFKEDVLDYRRIGLLRLFEDM